MAAKTSPTKTTPAAPVPAKPAESESFFHVTRNSLAEWSVTILMLLFGTTTILQAFVVPTGSMESQVLIGDHLLVDKLVYSPPGSISRYLLPYSDVKRGDIVVFRYPPDIRQNYVKRVIGIPGDRLRIVDKQVYLNGRMLDEPYKTHIRPGLGLFGDSFPEAPDARLDPSGYAMLVENVVNGELVVPAGKYFVMGDNRDNSADSRFWGFVPRENIIGKPVIIFWSYDTTTERLASGNLDPEHLWDIATNLFSKTRWRRTFQLVRGYSLE